MSKSTRSRRGSRGGEDAWDTRIAYAERSKARSWARRGDGIDYQQNDDGQADGESQDSRRRRRRRARLNDGLPDGAESDDLE